MYRVYIIDYHGAYWLRRWVGDCPLLSTKRDHAMTFKTFGAALEQVHRLKKLGNDAHIDRVGR